MRPKGSSARLEQRRRDAVAMLGRGVKAAAVAKAVGVSVVSVGRWRKAAAAGGARAKALAAKPVPGRPPKLTAARRRELLELLRQGAVRHGFGTELWTLARVAEVVRRRWRVSYHPSQVWRILRGLGWSCQKPQCRARERDEEAIERWRRADWPRLKKRRRNRPQRAVPRRDGPDAPAAGATHLGAAG
ncbi:MAG TPA: winged helix-turn-helix domain-containing protein [Tepidisphaeraceae bacterium]|nr:winged helix-turn-helix domain-containing protein [Tepidisphaeraceae bacterium]